jgi:hypothetical protein
MPRFNIPHYVRVRSAVRGLIQACDTAPDPPSAFYYAICELNEARPKQPQGRPRSPQANGPRLSQLREEAGLTRPELIDAIKRRKEQDGFTVKSLQRYESSAAASPANLEAIAAVLSKKLRRAVTAEDLRIAKAKKARAKRPQAAKKAGR